MSFDASSKVFRGEDLALVVGSDNISGEGSSVWEERVKRAEP